MSFINQTNTAFINAKLTDLGRKLLASGQLTYNYYVFGDSEINYTFNSDYDQRSNLILSPKDNNPGIKYPISPLLNNDPFNVLPVIISTKNVIKNTVPTRGFFNITGSTINVLKSGFTTSDVLKFNSNTFTGTTTIDTSSSVNSSIINDYLLIGIRNRLTLQSEQTEYQINMDETIPYLWFKILNIAGSTLTLDRPVPNITGTTSIVNGYVYPYASGNSINNFYSSASTIPYWSVPTLSFESNSNLSSDNVKVWNMNIVSSENYAGLDSTLYKGFNKYPSAIYNGFKEYVNNHEKKSIGIIHYSNNSISNYYGEGLVPASLVMTLPTVLYSENINSQIGLVLSGKTATVLPSISVTHDYNSVSIFYNELVDTFGNVVGKIFNDLKVIVIEDEEILAALSYLSNRNWTLPPLTGNFIASNTGDADGLLATTEQVYVTYLFSNEKSTGYKTGLHCLKYKVINRGGSQQNNIVVRFPVGKLPFMSDSGWTANKLYILVQKTSINTRPISTIWKKIDVTSLINSYVGGNINKLNIENSEFTITKAIYDEAPIYNLNDHISLPTISDTTKISFNEEVFLYGNIDTQIQATTYKSSFTFSAPASLFNSSINPTFAGSGNIYITEVGIYNSARELVAIGKLSKPLAKTSSGTSVIQLDIDF